MLCVFHNFNESAWLKDSRNIPIREVEDRLLDRANDLSQKITLTPVDSMSKELLNGFDVVVGADGSKSWVNDTFFEECNKVIVEDTKSTDYALGVAFTMPDGGLPLSQGMNMVLTVSQRRYLLNASSISGSGYLNIALSEDEMKLVTNSHGAANVSNPGMLPVLVHGQGAPEDAFTPYVEAFALGPYGPGMSTPASKLWTDTVCDGLKLFNIPQECVTSVVGIKLRLNRATTVITSNRQHIPKDGKPCVYFLIGDAAFSTHFWPGRGMNSALKEAAMLGLCLRDWIKKGVRKVHTTERVNYILSPHTDMLFSIDFVKLW